MSRSPYPRTHESAGIPAEKNESVTQLFRNLGRQHPALQSEEVARILTSMASIVDTVNSIRNRSSLVHPTDRLLEQPEALLVIYMVRTMIHYIDARTQGEPG